MTDLARLFHRQWALPMLVGFFRRKPVTVARQTYNDTLAALAEQGLVTRDGTLTTRGQKVAERGEALLGAVEKSGGLRKWSLPILHALGSRPRRFGELKTDLPGATPRARQSESERGARFQGRRQRLAGVRLEAARAFE